MDTPDTANDDAFQWAALPSLGAKTHAFVPDQIAQTLKKEIAAGRIPPGTKLPEVLLATSMNVSRHTLRAGLHVLEEEGMARREPNRGVFVISPTLADLTEVYRVRRIVEPGILRTVPFDAAAAARLEAAVNTTDVESISLLAESNQTFHRLIVEHAGSDVLSRAMSRIFALMQLAFSDYVISDYTDFRTRHFTIIEYLRRGDTERAAQTLDTYLRDSERIALTRFKGRSGAAT